MKDTELCKLLEQLHHEIEGAQSVNEKELALLHELRADIRELLERCEAEDIQSHPLTMRRFEEAIDSLAVNHPTLTSMISNISTILSNAGI